MLNRRSAAAELAKRWRFRAVMMWSVTTRAECASGNRAPSWQTMVARAMSSANEMGCSAKMSWLSASSACLEAASARVTREHPIRDAIAHVLDVRMSSYRRASMYDG